MNHTEEPWRYMGFGGIAVSGFTDTYAGPVWGTIVHCKDTTHRDSEGRTWCCNGSKEDNARRIVAAVNACAGIPTEALESDVVRRMRDLLSEIITITDRRHEAWDRARALLKELEG